MQPKVVGFGPRRAVILRDVIPVFSGPEHMQLADSLAEAPCRRHRPMFSENTKMTCHIVIPIQRLSAGVTGDGVQ